MKRFALLMVTALCCLTTHLASAQQTDQRLEAKFTQSEIADLEKNDPEAIEFWTFYLDNGYSIMEMPKGKGADLPEVEIENEEDFNVLALQLDPQEVGNRYFRIKGSGKLLALHSYSEVREKLSATKK